MRFAIIFVALAVLAWAAPAQAANQLDVFRALEGCWVGTFEDANGLQDERCFTPMQSGKQWRDVHAVVGVGYGGETIYAFDAEADRIVVTYYANDGGLMRGHADVVDGGVDFPDARYVGADGAVQDLRSRWHLMGADRFDIATERREGGVWRLFMRLSYRRAAAPETAAH
jgi:hypothetical protein